MDSLESGNEGERDRSADPPNRARRSSDRTRIAVLAGTGLVVSFMQTAVTPLYPRLPEYLGARPSDVAWVLTATLLAAVVSTPISARMGDMYGKRRVLLGLLAVVAVGNGLAMFSNDLPTMIVARALQGIGIGAITIGISMLRDVVHPRSLTGAVALLSATMGIGGALGLPLAGMIAEQFDWHKVFVTSAVLTVLVGLGVIRLLPPSVLRSGGRFDLVGALGAAVGLVALMLAISKASTWGWGAVALGLAALPVFALWGRRQLRVRDPFVDLRVAAKRPVLLTNLASLTVGFAFFVLTASLPIKLVADPANGVGFGLNLVAASLCLAPFGLVMFAVSPLAGRFTRARGARASLILGISVIIVAFTFGAVLNDELWQLILISTTTGAGIGFAYGALPTLIMAAVPASETAAANGLNSMVRTIGSTVSATLVGAIIGDSMIDGMPQRIAFVAVFAIGAAVLSVGLVFAILLPRRTQVGWVG